MVWLQTKHLLPNPEFLEDEWGGAAPAGGFRLTVL